MIKKFLLITFLCSINFLSLSPAGEKDLLNPQDNIDIEEIIGQETEEQELANQEIENQEIDELSDFGGMEEIQQVDTNSIPNTSLKERIILAYTHLKTKASNINKATYAGIIILVSMFGIGSFVLYKKYINKK